MLRLDVPCLDLIFISAIYPAWGTMAVQPSFLASVSPGVNENECFDSMVELLTLNLDQCLQASCVFLSQSNSCNPTVQFVVARRLGFRVHKVANSRFVQPVWLGSDFASREQTIELMGRMERVARRELSRSDGADR
jgi:hypothetical protein